MPDPSVICSSGIGESGMYIDPGVNLRVARAAILWLSVEPQRILDCARTNNVTFTSDKNASHTYPN